MAVALCTWTVTAVAVLGFGPVIIHTHSRRAPDWVARLKCLGFKHRGDATSPEWHGPIMFYGRAQIVVAVVKPGTAAAARVERYGDMVADLGLYVDQVVDTYEAAVRASPQCRRVDPISWPLTWLAPQLAVVGGPGQITHTLYRARPRILGSGVPGLLSLPGIRCVGLAASDTGAAELAAEFYVKAFGFGSPAALESGTMLCSGAAVMTVALDPCRGRPGDGGTHVTVHHVTLTGGDGPGIDLVISSVAVEPVVRL